MSNRLWLYPVCLAIDVFSMNGLLSEKVVDEFRKKYNRAPRVLHIGNIANNAYLNSKYLNEAGFDCDVICYDYYHIMGCPEWEDAIFDAEGLDHFDPNWSEVNLNGYSRPKWFAQGPQSICIEYLIAKRRGRKRASEELWNELSYYNKTAKKNNGNRQSSVLLRWALSKKVWLTAIYEVVVSRPDALSLIRKKLLNMAARYGRKTVVLAEYIAVPLALLFAKSLRVISGILFLGYRKISRKDNDAPDSFDDMICHQISIFNNKYKFRVDRLSRSDFDAYSGTAKSWKRLCEQYDMVIGYATDGVYPMLAGVPYVAYEHGTIRNIPFEKTAQGRMCSLVYASADHVFITNCDNIYAARRLQLDRYSFIPHPVNESCVNERISADGWGGDSSTFKRNEFVVFHPARHSWSPERHPDWEKGNDIIIKGFARFAAEIKPNKLPRLILVEWGGSVDKSKMLIESLGIDDLVIWVSPLPHQDLVAHIREADVIVDQISVGAFGSLLAKALMCGKPSLCWIEEDVHRECFPELPPIINVKDDAEVASKLTLLSSNESYRQQVSHASRKWYFEFHSRSVIVENIANVVSKILT